MNNEIQNNNKMRPGAVIETNIKLKIATQQINNSDEIM